MSSMTEGNFARRMRICQLTTWHDFDGLGIVWEESDDPPATIELVQSNSPAAAGGVKIRDIVYSINGRDMIDDNYEIVEDEINGSLDKNKTVELFVIEERTYNRLLDQNMPINRDAATKMSTPKQMPPEYKRFRYNEPRTCVLKLEKNNAAFGFELAKGQNDRGAYIQDIIENTVASKSSLWKNDRIIELNDKFIDNEDHLNIIKMAKKAKGKRKIKLYVLDTKTYEYFQSEKIPLKSKQFEKFKKSAKGKSLVALVERRSTESSSGESDESGEDTVPVTSAIPKLAMPPKSKGSDDDSESTNDDEDDIRLCLINRVDAQDKLGFQIDPSREDNCFTLVINRTFSHKLSNAELAGVRQGDYLIEVNGENVEAYNTRDIQQLIGAKKYPEPVEILVVSENTFRRYKQKGQKIHRRLSQVKKLSNPQHTPPTSISALVTTTSAKPVSSRSSESTGSESSSSTRSNPPKPPPTTPLRGEKHILYLSRDVSSFGFNFQSTGLGSNYRKISSVAKDSPAAKAGILCGQVITGINEKNVENLNESEFRNCVTNATESAKNEGTPLVLHVIEDSDSSSKSSIHESHYPEMRLCTIRSLPGHNQIGFQISAVSNRLITSKAYQIKRLVQGSPADLAKIREDDYVIEVNGRNIEKDSEESVPAHVEENYRKNNSVELLVIDEHGYQRYKTHGLSFNKTSPKAKITRYETPTLPLILTSRSSTSSSSSSSSSSSPYRALKDEQKHTCHIRVTSDKNLGFEVVYIDGKHIIRTVSKNSAASNLRENDRVIKINGKNIEKLSEEDVKQLLRNAAQNGEIVLEVGRRDEAKPPSSVIVKPAPPITIPTLQQPTDPCPRLCVILKKSSFQGCGFRLVRSDIYDTPVVANVQQNSPARRSGLAEGDHIIYVESKNVQKLGEFDDVVRFVQRTFDTNGQVRVTVLTHFAYKRLKKAGGLLTADPFNYLLPSNPDMKPRLCKLNLHDRENDFGLNLAYEIPLKIQTVNDGSSAHRCGIKNGDIVLEINGQDISQLPVHRVNETLKISKQEKKLEILVIDSVGYKYSVNHAIPLNSMLPIVKIHEETVTEHPAATSKTSAYL